MRGSEIEEFLPNPSTPIDSTYIGPQSLQIVATWSIGVIDQELEAFDLLRVV